MCVVIVTRTSTRAHKRTTAINPFMVYAKASVSFNTVDYVLEIVSSNHARGIYGIQLKSEGVIYRSTELRHTYTNVLTSLVLARCGCKMCVGMRKERKQRQNMHANIPKCHAGICVCAKMYNAQTTETRTFHLTCERERESEKAGETKKMNTTIAYRVADGGDGGLVMMEVM